MKETWTNAFLVALGARVATLPIMPARVAQAILNLEIGNVVARSPTVCSRSVPIVATIIFQLDQSGVGVGEVIAQLWIVVR